MADLQQGFQWEKHVTAIGAVATVTSTAASPLMNDFRAFGYILAGTSILLYIAVAWMRNKDVPGKKLRWMLTLILSISVGSLSLLWWSYEHPPVKEDSRVPPAQPPVIYHNETSGAQSPVVTGEGAVVNIGGSIPADSTKKRAKR